MLINIKILYIFNSYIFHGFPSVDITDTEIISALLKFIIWYLLIWWWYKDEFQCPTLKEYLCWVTLQLKSNVFKINISSRRSHEILNIPWRMHLIILGTPCTITPRGQNICTLLLLHGSISRFLNSLCSVQYFFF